MSFFPRLRRSKQHINLQVENLERRELLSATLWQIGSDDYNLAQTFLLHSNPTAKHVVYLDFDGHTNGNVYGSSWDNLTSPAWDLSKNGATFTDTEKQTIQRIWARVAEDFAPFNLDITTQDPGVEALRKTSTTDDRWGVRVVITPNDRPAPGSGGVAYVGSFNFNTDTPVYVFNVSEKSVAEAASHEVGHSLGLNHDGTGTLAYYSGHGSGQTSWGPILGASYSPLVTQWSKGEYAGANNKEDDLAKITTQNGFTYRPDDFGSSQDNAFALLPQGSTTINALHGLIERNTDADWFSFWSAEGDISLDVDPMPLGPNLAVRADLYNGNGVLLTTVNPANALNAAVDFTLTSPGQYFLKVSGTGKGDPLTNGFTSYGSLGHYRLTGNVQAYNDGGTPVNSPPVTVADVATTVVDTPVTINVLGNDSDPDGDSLALTSVTDLQNGTATILDNAVIFTPDAGFSGTGSFTYSVSDGKGGTASGTATVTVSPGSSSQNFTNDTDVFISSGAPSTVTSSLNVSGLAGVIQDVEVKVNLFHTYDRDVQITLIAPDGTRILLFNRHGGNGDNIVNTTFNDAASLGIWNASAPFSGSFRPWQALGGLNGKNPNGTWKLEIKDNARYDGGRLDNWTLALTTTGTASTTTRATFKVSKPQKITNLATSLQFAKSHGISEGANWNVYFNGFHFGLEAPQGKKTNTLFTTIHFLTSSPHKDPASLFEQRFGAELEGDLPAGF
jgi:subtilisin-like proprotein convertase family protein